MPGSRPNRKLVDFDHPGLTDAVNHIMETFNGEAPERFVRLMQLLAQMDDENSATSHQVIEVVMKFKRLIDSAMKDRRPQAESQGPSIESLAEELVYGGMSAGEAVRFLLELDTWHPDSDSVGDYAARANRILSGSGPSARLLAAKAAAQAAEAARARMKRAVKKAPGKVAGKAKQAVKKGLMDKLRGIFTR